MGRPRLHVGEDVVYVGLGLLLAGCSLALLVTGLINFGQNLMAGSLTTNIVAILDRVLLILLVVELLYTVQVSFREHALMLKRFLLIGLIAGIRRVLLLTAELVQVHEKSAVVFQHFIMELSAHGPDCCPRYLTGSLAKADRNRSDRTCKMNPGSSSRQPCFSGSTSSAE
jgi:hypothetical protein